MAKERGLDLVEVAANVDPPVCKIIDYGKYKYIQEKHKKEAHKNAKTTKVKELKFRVGIDPHDYLIKIIHAEDFLFDGHKVRIQLQFKGRQMAHQELGHALAKRIKLDLASVGHADADIKQAGRNINMQMSALPERQRVRKFRTEEAMIGMKHVPHANEVDHSAPDGHEDEDDHDPAEELLPETLLPVEGESPPTAS